MKKIIPGLTIPITVIAQDPMLRDNDGVILTTKLRIPAEDLAPGPKSSRFHIIDYDATLDKFIAPLRDSKDLAEDIFKQGISLSRKRKLTEMLVSDPHFHAQNVYAIASATLFEFEKSLGRKVSWGFDTGAHQLKIAPHAFADANAFYSRKDEGLAFGYFYATEKANNPIFTCLSFDIVVHETTHAILDGLRSEYIHPSSIDQAAFHEAFSDIIAILMTFRSEELIAHGLGFEDETTIDKKIFKPSNLRKSFLFGLAEEMGTALSHHQIGEFKASALRRSVELTPSRDLYTDKNLRRSPHNFGEVLVAAILNAFIEIWSHRIQPLDPVDSGRIHKARAVEEGAKAASHLLGMCIRALDYLPPVNVLFSAYARAIITADFETAPDDTRYKYRTALANSFAKYGIIDEVDELEKLRWSLPEHADKIRYGFSPHSTMQQNKEAVFQFIWNNREALELSNDAFTHVVSVRPVTRKGPDGFVVRETVVEYTQTLNLLSSGLRKLGLERPDGMPTTVYVELRGGGTLIFDDYGILKYHIGIGVTGRHQSERLRQLWDAGWFGKTKARSLSHANIHRARMGLFSGEETREQW